MTRLVDLASIPARSVAPTVEWASAPAPNRSLYFAAEPYDGAPTKVFAYLATPEQGDHEADRRHPAIVLVHGGGGRAYACWATMWAQRGYVALALDLNGCGPDGTRHQFAGPSQSDASTFKAVATGVEHAWMYHAVADVLHAISLLAGLPEVNPDRIAVTGISWGAHVAELAIALDPRPRAAAFVYGCGYIRHNPTWAPAFDALRPDMADLWIEEFDPLNYLSRITIPTLWITGAKDAFYPLDRFRRSHRLLPGAPTLRVTPDFEHSHEDGWSPVEICTFVNAHLRGGPALAVLGDPVRVGGQVRASLQSDLPIERGELHYATAYLGWSQRQWVSTPAVIADGVVQATLPDVPVSAYFLTVEDVRGLVVSTEYGDCG
jgi:dienelactone hydrolase